MEKGIGAAIFEKITAGNVPKFDQRHIYTFKNSVKSKYVNIKKHISVLYIEIYIHTKSK